ncbi:hypothetical protein GCK72_022368 [Caenorhabditis remanei]|uniref:Sdz-33 F-box domain-containing protein n=1 Tax=Caenorhabditis remanei TaxID=31234 RepID=A0A6A5FU61_CAERE|nr:hypothetical protein GCK72_022368 [Caenorhabditis remanei]KAF1745921.1 hypothetical protein GCK72_022368 [Caenorhabditis remanei]
MPPSLDHLHIRACFRLEFWNEVEVSLCFYTENAPDLVDAILQKITFTQDNSGLAASKWLERILDVTNCESLSQVDLRGSPQLDVRDTFATIQNIDKLYIHGECPNTFAKKFLEIISPVATEITLFKIPFETRKEFQTFLKSNLNYLTIFTNKFPTFKFTVGDLMVTNALKLNIDKLKLTVKEINKFFKNWVEKKCDTRLEHLSLSTNEDVDERNLLEGLKTVRFPENQERTFHYSKELDSSSDSFSGGYDLRRADRNKATITFGDVYGDTYISFYAWK